MTVGAAGQPAPPPFVVGPNVNMVGGPATIATSPVFRIFGDPYLQRQNEPSMACSSRNPMNCLAAANDYRLVDTPGVKDGRVTGDAWIGVFWTRDEGLTWRSTMLPGFPQDNSPEGLASPLRGFVAGADPTVRAGTNGLFYVSGIAFDRASESTTTGGKTGSMFVALYIDDNNTERADTPIRYVRAVLVDKGTNGQFLDKPWIAADIPRGGATCQIPAGAGVPAQTVPAGVVYAAYSTFLGSGNNQHSKLLFTRSTDCGVTWSNPTMLDESVEVSQSANIAIDPNTGAVLVAWRQFGDSGLSDPSRVRWARSTDFGKSFTKAGIIRDLGLPNASKAIDLVTRPIPEDPGIRMFRSNGYPSACIDSTGLYRVAWAERGIHASGDARIVVSTWRPGEAEWSAPAAVDNHAGRGHQLMPAMVCTADRATVAWYDQRWTEADLLDAETKLLYGGSVFGPWIIDPIPLGAHTIDVRAAQTAPGAAAFGASASVSRYQFALLQNGSSVKVESNPVNWPLFAGGRIPFLGDYIDLVPSRTFLPPIDGQGWRFNTDAAEPPVLHAAWADNRDIPKPPFFSQYDWANWSAAGTAACDPNLPTYTRNQNVYTSRLSAGLSAGASGNSRVVPDDAAARRAFAVFVRNSTPLTRYVQLSVPSSGPASFRTESPAQTTHLAKIDPYSSITRTVFVVPSTPPAATVVQVKETDGAGRVLRSGLYATAVINGDPASPPPFNTDVLQGVEIYTPELTDAFIQSYRYDGEVLVQPYDVDLVNPLYLNPRAISPRAISPRAISPRAISDALTPRAISSNMEDAYVSQTFTNPTYLSDSYLSPRAISTSPEEATEITWGVTNTGNVATGYNFSALLASLPAGVKAELIVSRVHTMPSANGCQPASQFYTELVARIPAPDLSTPVGGGNPVSSTNATFSLAAGDLALVTLRTVYPPTVTFDPTTVSALVVSQPDPDARDVSDLAAPVVTAPGAISGVEATSAAGAVVTYTPATAVDLVDGTLTTVSCAPASGSTFALGTTTVTCSATDGAGNTGTATFTVTVVDTTAPSFAAPANILAEASSAAGAIVTYVSPVTADAVSGAGVATCSPASGSTFPMGTTTVTCTATDTAGNSSSRTFTVTVRDTTPPAIIEVANPNTLIWSPNKTMTPVTVSGNVTDAFGILNGTVSYRVQDEYKKIQPAGTASIASDGRFSFVILLEAWRNGTDTNGRTYTVFVTATDVNKNTTTASTIVLVPHSSK